MSGDLADAAARLLEGRTSRRGLLIRLAVAGSAIAVAPLRYLLRPGTAMAVITCSQCGGGARCCDGWTDFCCVINPTVIGSAGWCAHQSPLIYPTPSPSSLAPETYPCCEYQLRL